MLVPDGLLQRAGSVLYNYRPRHMIGDEDSQPLTQVIEQPAQAVLATDVLIKSRTPGYGPSGRLQGEPRRNRSSVALKPSRPMSYHEQRSWYRAASPNLATSSSRREQAVTHSVQSTPPETSTMPRTSWPLFGKHSSSTTSSETYSASRKVSHNNIQAPQIPPETQSVGLHDSTADRCNDDPNHSERSNVVPEGDPVSVRRPTVDDQAHRMSLARRLSTVIAQPLLKVIPRPRQTSTRDTYERAKIRQKRLQRSKPFQIIFQYTTYLLLLTLIYFVLVGRPLWGGTVWYIYVLFDDHLTFVGGSAIFLGLAFL